MPRCKLRSPPVDPGVGFMALRVGDRFQGSWPCAAQAGVLPKATNRRELSSRSIVIFETIEKTHITWGSNIEQKADGGGPIGPHS